MGICASQAVSWASFAKLYEIDEKVVLAERPFAVIYKGKHRVTGEAVAIKRIQKFLSPQQVAQLEAISNADAATASAASRRRSGCHWESEVAIVKQLSARHPNVIEFKQLFEMKDEVLIVMEVVAGGELFDALISDGAYSEWDAKRFVKDTLEALKFLHERNIIHRDIKPENLLFTSRDSKGASIKVVNFAMAKLVNQDSAVTNSQLTWPYCAPEILASIDGFSSLVESMRRRKSSVSNDQASSSDSVEPVSSSQAQTESQTEDTCATPVGVKCDVWSVGIVLYVLLSGAHPFDLDGRQTKDQIVQNILLGKFAMSDESSIWSSISREAKSLLTALLEVDPEKRPCAAQALDHEWFASPHTPRHPLSVSISDGLGQYQRLMRKKFRTEQPKFMTDLGNSPLAEEAIRPVEIAGGADLGTTADIPIKKQGSVMSRVFQKQNSMEDREREHPLPIDTKSISLEDEEKGFDGVSLQET